jgi:hypothetical protein
MCVQPAGVAVWNSPLDVTFAFSGVDGWPLLLITVMETDAHDRQDLGGYGLVRLPTSPGSHIRRVPIVRPRGSWGDAVTSFFVGGRPRYRDAAAALCGTESRYGHRTVSMGMVELHINVAIQGFQGPEMNHVHFQAAEDPAAAHSSVCAGCPPTITAATIEAEEDAAAEEEEERSSRKGPDQQSLLRKEQ